VKAAEASEFENEIKKLREENAELRRRTGEITSLEAAKKKAESKAEQLEQKVKP
jgi:homeobox protein cut-like